MKARLIVQLALVLATLGMALVVLGVTTPGLFFPGIYLLDGALLGLFIAGIMHMVTAQEPA